MRLYTISIKPMDHVTDEQLDGLLSELRYYETRDSMRAILTDGHPSNAAEHIKEQYVHEITEVLDSLDLEYEVILETD